MLESGIRLVRVDLAAAAVLALLSLVLWRRGTVVQQEPPGPPPTRLGAGLGALVLLVIVAALAFPRLGTTLWWDELSTLLKIKRGPLVILTYSDNGNNHLLNSLLIWASLRVLVENEVVLHLFPFLFSLTAVGVLYWAILRVAGLRVALLSGLAAATQPWLITHGVEARGYAGAILFSWVAILVFARLLTHGLPRLTALYIASCVTAFGFIPTTLLVPFAHGALACLLLVAGYRWPDLAPYRANAVNLIFACLWVAVLALLLFGLPLPQVLAYARYSAFRDHLPLGWELGGQVLDYFTGLRVLVPAAFLAGVTCLGWWAALRRGSPRPLRLILLSSLVPLGPALLYVLLPGTNSSPRLFCFLLLPVCCGVGLGLDWLTRPRTGGRLAAALLLLGWLGLLGVEHQRLLHINRPDLKALARELQGTPVALIGAQAEVNTYYFPQATTYQVGRGQATLQEAVAHAEVVVEGRSGKDNRLEEPDAGLVALGFRVEKTLANAIDGTEYLVYRRAREKVGSH
jgi:hypothetical protein